MSAKNLHKHTKKVIAVGLCASLVGGVAAPVLSTSDVAQAAEANVLANTSDSSVIQFKDENLKKAILFELHEQNLIDYSVDNITKGDALKLKILDLSYQGMKSIKSIEGLEFFKNLETLVFYDNQVSDISPLAGLSKLTKLNLAYNGHISDLTPLATLTGLTSLDLRNNSISDLTPLAGLTKLTGLYLEFNQISDITPLASLSKLTKLSLSDNQISDITPLAPLTNLDTLYAQGQTITLYPKTIKVDLTKEIKGAGNVIFGSNKNLVNGVLIYKDGMQNPYTVHAKDGDKYSATVNVDFSNAKSPIIQFKDPVLKKRILSCMKTEGIISSDKQDITEEDALKVNNLELQKPEGGSPIISLNGIEKFKNLTDLDLEKNQISDTTPLKDLLDLGNLNLSYNQISDVTPLKGLNNLSGLNLNYNKISDITQLKDLSDLMALDLERNQISDISSLKNLSQLMSLDLNDNKISDITPLSGMTELIELYLHNNQISDVSPLKGLANLTKLQLSWNQISDVSPLKDLTKLNFIILDENRIKSLECLNALKPGAILATNQKISLNPTTATVDLKKEIRGLGNVKITQDENIVNGVLTYKEKMENPYQVGVSEIVDEKHTYSATITIDFSEVKSPIIQFKDERLKKALLAEMKNQKLISENAADITKDDALKLTTFGSNYCYSFFDGIQNFKNLTSLYADNISISDFEPLASLTKLTNLSLQRNDISDLKFITKLTNLVNLKLRDNQISDLAPLKSLTKLETLDLVGNQISDITPLKNLSNLTSLEFDENNISDLTPLKGLTKLEAFGSAQSIDLQPTTTTVDLKKIIKGVDNITFDKDNNIVDGVLTYKEGMENPYQVIVNGKLGENDYSAIINVDFSKAKLDSEIQAENNFKELQQLLDGYNVVKATDNYKNADDNLKQAYDKAITDGKAICDKLSSTFEQVKQAAEQIKTTLGKLNGDSKSKETIKNLQTQLNDVNGKIQTLFGELEKAKQQGTVDKATIQSLADQLQQAKNTLEQLKSDKTKSDEQKQKEIKQLNTKIAELEKQIKTHTTQPTNKPAVTPLPTLDKEEHKPANNNTSSSNKSQTNKTSSNTSTSDVNTQKPAHVDTTNNTTEKVTVQPADKKEQTQLEQKAGIEQKAETTNKEEAGKETKQELNKTDKQQADKEKVSEHKLPKTSDNSLLAFLGVFNVTLALMVGHFTRKKLSKTNKKN